MQLLPVIGQVFIIQLLSAIDAATYSLHCSLSSAVSRIVILCFPDVFLNLDTLALLRTSSTLSIHLFDGLLLMFRHLAATDKLFCLFVKSVFFTVHIRYGTCCIICLVLPHVMYHLLL